jgi:peptidoglycan hydrolase CwlO-like protein
MSKNYVIQLFIDWSLYESIKEAAAHRRIMYKTDSELIRKVCNDYCDKIAWIEAEAIKIDSKVKELQEQLTKNESLIDQLRAENRQLDNTNRVLRNNMEVMIAEKKKKNHKKAG